jgi:antirestriction protein ArdC
MTKANTAKVDIQAQITGHLVAVIEARLAADPTLADTKMNVPLWARTPGAPLWMPSNAATGNNYNGINIIALWAQAETRDFHSAVWGTYRQWAGLGCQVKQGEKAAQVVLFKEFDVETDQTNAAENSNDNGTDNGKRYVARASCVFNSSQVEGYAAPEPVPDHGLIARLATADAFCACLGARIEIGGERAYYDRSTDHVQMPREALFTGSDTMDRNEAWYAVLAHELTHYTGASTRLDRTFGQRFGDNAYAMEELTAEIGAAFLCAELGIAQQPRADHANYLLAWLRIIKGDTKAIFTAAAAASKAVAWMKDRQPKPQTAVSTSLERAA